MFILPDVGLKIVDIMRKVVVFPAPLGPNNENTLPGVHFKLTLSTATAILSVVLSSFRCCLERMNSFLKSVISIMHSNI